MHTPALWEPQFINGRFVGVTENTDMNIDENRLSLNLLVKSGESLLTIPSKTAIFALRHFQTHLL